MELTQKEIFDIYERIKKGEKLIDILLNEFADKLFYEQIDKDVGMITYEGYFLHRKDAQSAINNNYSPFSQDKSYIYEHKFAELQEKNFYLSNIDDAISRYVDWIKRKENL